jgi:hypothetical protein
MTPEQLAHYEAAARIYCKLRDLNADEVTKLPHPIILGHTIDVPLWHEVAEQLAHLGTALVALKQAREAEGTAH